MKDPFELAADELASGTRVKALYARCFVDAEGDEKKASALYIKTRAHEISAKAAHLERLGDDSYETFLLEYKRQNLLWFLVWPCFLRARYEAWLVRRTATREQLQLSL